MTEHEFHVWQQMSNACVVAGKPPGGPWSFRVTGMCALSKRKIGAVGTGEGPYITSAVYAMLHALSEELGPEVLAQLKKGIALT